ncbi:universal stress protein [Natronoarchaeum mannanilyticum]|uniref:Universal stress protein n=1 Tax=Natronoarchaeum mannanilyticum TaxID=926360 RepID=A0AAV3T4G8_9EURY
MTLLVPFDGSELSAAALDRATEFGEFTGEDVVALAVIPPDAEFARDRGWLDAGEQFDTEMICTRLRQQVEDVSPEARFRCEETEETDYRATLTTDVTRTIRQVAADLRASIIFVGSENAGRVSTPLTSVGNPLSEDPRYDVHIVRHAD